MVENVRYNKLVPIDAVHDAYSKQILEGPLKVLITLIDKEHFQAAKDILPIVQDSLIEFEVPTIVVPSSLPPESLDSSVDIKALIGTVERLSGETQDLYKLLLSLTAPGTNPGPLPEPEKEVAPEVPVTVPAPSPEPAV